MHFLLTKQGDGALRRTGVPKLRGRLGRLAG